MTHTRFLKPGLALVTLLVASPGLQAQHVNAGAISQSQGSQLIWANGADYVNTSGYVRPLAFATTGTYAGLWNSSGPTLTALSSTNGGASLGSFLSAEIVSVEGPAGATFAWYEGVDQGGGPTPAFSALTGSSGLSFQFDLSDTLNGAGQPGGDPFGHLHGRRWTFTDEGTYTIGFRVLDTSANGLGGGPIHTPSEILYMNFAPVPEPSTLALGALGVTATWWLRRRRNT
jgi:PEP-CTERM motif